MKKTYMNNQIIKMGFFNCFEELTSVKLHLKYCNSIVRLSLGAKKKNMQPMRLFKLMPQIVLESCLNELPQYLGSSNTYSSINELINFQVSILIKGIFLKNQPFPSNIFIIWRKKNLIFFFDISENSRISVIDAKVK